MNRVLPIERDPTKLLLVSCARARASFDLETGFASDDRGVNTFRPVTRCVPTWVPHWNTTC